VTIILTGGLHFERKSITGVETALIANVDIGYYLIPVSGKGKLNVSVSIYQKFRGLI